MENKVIDSNFISFKNMFELKYMYINISNLQTELVSDLTFYYSKDKKKLEIKEMA